LNPLFDLAPNRRNTSSEKWDKYKGQDIIPLWVADMDFRAPPAILKILQERLDHGVLGYTRLPQALSEAVCTHLYQNYHWKVEPQWLVFLPGLVTGLNLSCASVGNSGDSVLTLSPVYPPFFTAPQNQQRKILKAPLIQIQNHWHIDFTSLEQIVQKDTQLFLLCNPHNPVGKCYTEQELLNLAAFCEKKNLILCSDEIHNEIILAPHIKHIPIASLSPEIAQRTITLLSPSKICNIPGLGASVAVIPNDSLRRRFKQCMAGIVPQINLFGVYAALAAYQECADWKKQLISYLQQNLDDIYKELGPCTDLKISPLEATYLAWIDTRSLQLKNPVEFFEKWGVGLSQGSDFGLEGFVRLNFGCAHDLLLEAIKRIKLGIESVSRIS